MQGILASSQLLWLGFARYRLSPAILIPADLIPHMSKKFKSQASSSRAAAGAFGSFGGFSGSFGNDGREPSTLTYIAEPPDLSRISEQQLVIAFKNLQKKDDTTRTKALEELKDHISSVEAKNGTLDDGFLEAWVCYIVFSFFSIFTIEILTCVI